MLSPNPSVQGPIPRITTLLVGGLRTLGCDVEVEPWGRHSDTESLAAKVFGRFRDVVQARSRASATRFDAIVVKTSLEWVSLLRDVPLLIAIRGRAPQIVLEFHGGNPDRLEHEGNHAFKWLSRLLFRLCDGGLFLSTEEARGVQAFYPRGCFEVFVNPFVAPDADRPREQRTDGQTILYAGRLVPEKGIFDTLEAFALLRTRRPCRLIVAGSGAAAADAAARVEVLGLSDDVTLVGQLSHREVTAMYHSADVFVLPTYWAEGFPTAIAEAMSAGLPIVTTQLRGMADHLLDGINAVFVPPRAPTKLADALEQLLDDDALRDTMAAANRRKVRDFAPEKAAAIYVDALARITGEPAPVET